MARTSKDRAEQPFFEVGLKENRKSDKQWVIWSKSRRWVRKKTTMAKEKEGKGEKEKGIGDLARGLSFVIFEGNVIQWMNEWMNEWWSRPCLCSYAEIGFWIVNWIQIFNLSQSQFNPPLISRQSSWTKIETSEFGLLVWLICV